jgi:hypothetical protein
MCARSAGQGKGRVLVASGITAVRYTMMHMKKNVPEFRHNFFPRLVCFIKKIKRELVRGIHKYNCRVRTWDWKLKLEDRKASHTLRAFEPMTSSVLEHMHTLMIHIHAHETSYQNNASPLPAIFSFSSQIALLLLNWSVTGQGIWLSGSPLSWWVALTST